SRHTSSTRDWSSDVCSSDLAARGRHMTAGGPPKGSIAETVQTTDGFLRHAGREFLVVLYTAVRSLKLYPIENAQVQKALDDLTKIGRASCRERGAVEVGAGS